MNDYFPQVKKKEKDNPCSEIFQEMLDFRENAILELDIDAIQTINKHIEKQKKNKELA